MSVTGVSNISSSVSGTGSVTGNNSTDDAQSRFMKLLIAQLQNQDPLNPMDNAAMTSQMAQLNMVSGINQLNTTLSTLTNNQQNTEALTASGLLGHKVLVSGNTLSLANGEATWGMDLKQAAETVTVNILDSHGNSVRTLDLGAQPAGLQTFNWDGQTDSGTQAADGAYSFSVDASNAGQAVTANGLALGTVNNVSLSGGLLKLNVGQFGDVNVSDIRQIF